MKFFIIAISAALIAASCAPSTPQARIQRHPEKFESLGQQHRELVQNGQLEHGMSQDAVFLAWGAPSRTFQGSRNNRMSERWDYSGTRPIHTDTFNGTLGRHHGPCMRQGFSGFGWGPDIVHIPYHIASVWFIDNRVDSWERAR
jgi:hypothetical protein